MELATSRLGQGHIERQRHPPGHVRLHLEHVGDGGVERLLPARLAGGSNDQLRAHLDPSGALFAPVPANGAGQQIADTELLAELPRRLLGAVVLARAAARGHT